MNRKLLAAGLAVFLALGLFAGSRWFVPQRTHFSAAPAGPRAPTVEAAPGLRPGVSTLAQTKAATAALQCADRSLSTAIVAGLARAEGGLRYRLYGWLSPHAHNPQVRWDCTGPDGERWLLLHDDAEAPLRTLLRQRTFTDEAAAGAELASRTARLVERFGPPPWKWADLSVSVALEQLGPHRFLVSDTIEVPWPVIASAPSLGR